MSDKPLLAKFPYVQCIDHGMAPGYIVCPHVAQGKAKAHYTEKPSEEMMGVISCEECFKRHADHRFVADNFKTMCAGHAKDFGLLPAK